MSKSLPSVPQLTTGIVPLIEAKRDGRTFSAEQIGWILREFTAQRIPDYQMSALLMAILFRGLNPDETRAWTLVMRDSGDTLRFPRDTRPLVDKHSTGGVGDKVSLVLAPLLACLGFRVPMISGRGLGITGGTLDKLESMAGFNVHLTREQIIDQVQKIGCVICAQTDRMVPADKALYALRDVTGTVPSIPLITASILSKKLAEGLDALVLDVKFGSAAFMETFEQALELARSMVRLGNESGVSTRALITDMNTPLGKSAGNWLEVKESVQCLAGEGPPDLEELVIDLAAHLLLQTKLESKMEVARDRARRSLHSGLAREKWDEMIAAQGADVGVFKAKLKRDSAADQVIEVIAPRAGYIQATNARVLGEIVHGLGAGRSHKDSRIDFEVGIDQIAKPGEEVEENGILCRLHMHERAGAEEIKKTAVRAFEIGEAPPKPEALIREIIAS